VSDSVKSLPRIVVEQRASDWKAYVQGDEAKWECGHSRSTAIGMFILSHGRLCLLMMGCPAISTAA